MVVLRANYTLAARSVTSTRAQLLVLETGVQVGVALKEDGCASVARLFMTPACSSVACAGSSLAHHLLSSAATAATANTLSNKEPRDSLMRKR